MCEDGSFIFFKFFFRGWSVFCFGLCVARLISGGLVRFY